MSYQYGSKGRLIAHPDLHPRNREEWRTDEIRYLIEHYDTDGAEAVGLALGRTVIATSGKATQLRKQGLIPSYNPSTKWSAKDEQFLIDNYVELGGKECARLLKRAPRAIKAKAQALRQAGRMERATPPAKWTAEQERFVIDNYRRLGAKGCGEALGRTGPTVVYKVYKLRRQGVEI